MIDCQSVIYAKRSCSLKEGQQLIVLVNGQEIVTGPKCTAIEFCPPEGGPDRTHVLVQFEDGTTKYIYDIDEVIGKEVL